MTIEEAKSLEVGNKVKYFISRNEYIIGEIVEICKDNTAWVRFSNDQELNYPLGYLYKQN